METDNKNEEHFHSSKHCWLKYFAVMILTLVGSYLATYFLIDYAIKSMMDPMHQMKRAERMIEQQERDMMRSGKNFEHDMAKDFAMAGAPYSVMNLVHINKDANEYKVVIDLKPFDGKADNINVSVNDDILSIDGKIEKTKRNKAKIVNFSQSYSLDEDVDASKMTKKIERDKYIITIPFED